MSDLDQLDQFRKHVHDALVHLYDVSYLQGHPLAQWVAPTSGPEPPGRVLRRLILESVQDLKPPPDVSPDSQVASRYQFLYLRYVRGESIQQIAKALSLGERQMYRRQHDALESVIAILWQKLRSSPDGGHLPSTRPTDSATVPHPSAEINVQQEVDRIGATRSQSPTNLREVLKSVLATVQNLLQGSDRAIVLDAAPELPPVAVDRVAIRQAILGLLVFSVEWSSGRAVRVTVVGDPTEVILRIHATGKSGHTPPPLSDTDSNLAVSKRLIELQDGVLGWQVNGRDLEFAIHLPAARPRTVLVVDDNPDTLHLFTRYLSPRAYHVRTAATGEEALRDIAQSQPDAVILDVMLPSADGWEVLESLRTQRETSQIPVIVCTVLKQRELALALGATDFVAKPTTQGDLLAALDRCWSLAREARQARPS